MALRATVKRNNANLEHLRSLVSPASKSLKSEQSSSSTKQQGASGALSFLTHSHSAEALGVTSIPTDSTSTHVATGPLETNTSFTLSQLPALRALLDDLRPKLETLGISSAGAREDDATRERRLYVESQTRKALERRGVEIVSETDTTDRRVGPDELAALESITEGLGGGSGMEE